MEKRTRRILFYPLLVIFIALAPFLLLYSLGYSFDLGTRRVTETGGIFLKSRLTRLSVYLDSKPMKTTGFFTGSALLTDVPEGNNILRLEREGYRPWTKEVLVRPFDVIELRNIILVPEEIIHATTTFGALPATTTPPSLGTPPVFIRKDALAITENGTTTIITKNVESFDIFANTVYFITTSGFFGLYNISNGTIETLGRPGFYLADPKPVFIASPRGTIAIIDSGGGLFTYDPERPLAPIESGVKTIRFDARGDKLLIQKEDELMLFWLIANQTQPFQKQFSKETIIRTPAPILNSAWFFRDNAHVIFQTNEGIYITEIDTRGGANTYELASGKFDEFFTSPETPNRIFLRKNLVWFSIDI